METIVLVSGGFDPLHSGHIDYFKAARALGDKLIVGVNSDSWLTRKKGRPFMSGSERVSIIQNLQMVEGCVLFNDNDNSSKEAINNVRTLYPSAHIIFANGGDRTSNNIPEMDVIDANLSFAFGIGGANKKNSSSGILNEWKAPKTTRPWGHYRVIHEYDQHTKVKELIVNPGKSLSMQRHKMRSEHWFIAEGTATVNTINSRGDLERYGTFREHTSLHVPTGMWHQLANNSDTLLKLVEIQYGQDCAESDIERHL